MWQQWVNLILGLWVVLSSYLNMSQTSFVTNYTIIGLVIAILAVWGAIKYQNEHRHGQHTMSSHSPA